MQPNTTVNTHQDTDPLARAPVPAELLETVARALATALIPSPRAPAPPGAEEPADFLTAAQLARRLGVSRETVRRLAIAGALPHTVVCRGTRKTTRRYPRWFADEFAASGLDVADLAGFAAQWRARVTAPAPLTASQPRHRASAAPARFAARWRELAACRGADLDLFFPGRGESAEAAQRVCARCPVRPPCLDYAISNRIVHGVWGGLTERERRALRSRWVRASRRDRDRAILAADTAGYTAAAIGRSFGLSHTSVTGSCAPGTTRSGRDEPQRRVRAASVAADRPRQALGW
jgi:WhiB family redox-sensing transcriptional regulator